MLLKLEVKLFFFLVWFILGVLRWCCATDLGVGVAEPELGAWPPAAEVGMLGTEWAEGRLRLGETGADSTESIVGVTAFWGVAALSKSPKIKYINLKIVFERFAFKEIWIEMIC